MNRYKSKDFKNLERHWYEVLRKEGFKDIEDTKRDDRMLSTWHSSYFLNKYTPESFESKKQYFDKATAFLHTFQFESKREHDVWAFHSDGMTVRDIARKFKTKIYVIHRIIVRLRDEMKEEMNAT